MGGQRRSRVIEVLGVVTLMTASMLSWPAPATALITNAPARTWGVGPASTTSASVGVPRVLTILPVGDRIYVGGTFDSVIDPSGVSYPVKNLAVFSATTGAADLSFAAGTNNTVTSLASDGGSTLYIGGTFGSVNGQSRVGLAAVNTGSGALQPWSPAVATSGQVDVITYVAGSVYAGGNFDSIAGSTGSSQPFLAKINASSGAVDTTWTAAPNDRVRALNIAADSSGRLFVGGDFTSISAKSGTNKIAAVGLSSPGSVDATFRAGPTNENNYAPVFDVISDSSRVYLAAAGSGGACTALNVATGARVWTEHGNGNLQSVRLTGGLLYCGGHFSGTASFGGQNREKLAAVNPATGALTSFAPNINSSQGTWALGADATHLYLGGDFSSVAGVAQPHFAMFVDSGSQTPPQPATNPEAQPGNGVVHLSWSASSSDGGSPLLKYKVYRSTTPGGQKLTKPPRASLTKNVLSFDDASVVNGTPYYYVIVATNAIGASPRTTEVSATPSSTTTVVPPGAPSSLTVTNPPGYNHLQWNPPSNSGGAPITSYRVYRGVAPGAEDLVTPMGTVSTTAFDDRFGLTAGTTYYYVVTAVNQAGQGAPSAEVSATVTPGTPGPPTLVGTPVTGPAVKLDWTVPADGGSPITKYVILRDTIRLITLTATPAGPITFTDTTVSPRVTYSYQVKAVNAYGNGQLSNRAIVTTP